MALVDLKTILKSLKFGGINPAYSDRTGAGFSNQPYIVKTNPQDLVADDLKQKEYDPLIPTLLPDNSIDFLTRGGILESARIDSERLTRFFDPTKAGASPNGALFIAKQEVLSQLSPKILGVNSEVNVLNNQNIYSPYNTIAQVLANGTPGLHLNKQGINPFIFSNKFGYDYATTEAEQPVDDNSGNGRLKLLYQLKVAKNQGDGIISVAKDFYGIKRGGLIPAVMVSHKLGLPWSDVMLPNTLVIDDIADTGVTLKNAVGAYTAVLHYKPHTSCHIPNLWASVHEGDEWIIYPWERKDSQTIQAYKNF